MSDSQAVHPVRFTAEHAHKVTQRAHSAARQTAIINAIEEAAALGLRYKTFWPDHVGHAAVPHGIIDALRDAGYKVSHKDLGSIEVHWPEPAVGAP